MRNRNRARKLRRALSLFLPFALPAGVLFFWFTTQCQSQNENNPLHIVASMDPDGGRTTTFSTILPDGNQAVWECSHGAFMETGDIIASGRTVTWQPYPGLEDSVSIVITTPSVSDTVRFLPVIPEMIPAINVSAAYHLAILERARSIQMAPGNYWVTSRADALRGYDGLVVLIVHTQQYHREAFGMLPGDTVILTLPLGGVVAACGLDYMEDAMDNSGSIQVVFEAIEPGDLPESSEVSSPSGDQQ